MKPEYLYKISMAQRKIIKQNMAFIYALLDPRDNKIRYIGKTNYLNSRYSWHIQTGLKYYQHKKEQKLLLQRKDEA